MNRRRFVVFHDRGFSLPFKIEFGVCKKLENVVITIFVFFFATLFLSETRNFSYN